MRGLATVMAMCSSPGSAPVIADFYSETNADGATLPVNAIGGTDGGQAFTVSGGGTLDSAKFYLSKIGTPTGNAFAKLYATTTGTIGTDARPTLAAATATSDPFNVATLTGSNQLITFNFTGANRVALTNGTNCIVFEYTGGDASNTPVLDGSSLVTDDGNSFNGYDQSAWNALGYTDLCFYVYKV